MSKNYFKLVKNLEKLPNAENYRKLDTKIENLVKKLKNLGLDSDQKINLIDDFQEVKEDVEENQENVGIIIEKILKMKKEIPDIKILYLIFGILFLLKISIVCMYFRLRSKFSSQIQAKSLSNKEFCSLINVPRIERVNSLYYSKTSLLHKFPKAELSQQKPEIEVRNYEIPKVKYSNTYEELIEPCRYENVERIYAVPNKK